MLKASLYILILSTALFLVLVQDFAHFVRRTTLAISAAEAVFEEPTGIVVATGSDGRIEAGLSLMLQGQKNGQVQGLLISGVGDGFSKADILRIAQNGPYSDHPGLAALLACCVELDYEAANTIGNALESGQWADRHGLAQLVLVTSDFHMPRALELFKTALPEHKIIAHAVPTPWLQTNRVGLSEWWRTPRRIQIIGREMVKYYANLI